MISLRPCLSGVLVIIASAPFLLGADNGVQVQSISTDQPKEIPFQAPVDTDKPQKQSGGELVYQLQVLQQDLQDLRGNVEDLQHQIKEIQSTQQSRYLDLDKRIQNLQQQLNQRGGQNPSGSVAQNQQGTIDDVNKEAPTSSSSASEKAMYDKALDMIRNRKFNDAITQLQAVIAKYPNGDLTANTYYWLGEVYAALPNPDYDKARQALAQVTTYFPKSRKVPDAMYKLGKVYYYMGDCKRSKEMLNKVVQDYQGKSVAKLAESFLHDNTDCKD